MLFFRLDRQILQPKSGIFGEKFNETSRKKGFFIAKGSHRNKSRTSMFKSMRFLPFVFGMSCLALLQESCTTSRFYAPNSMHIPMLTGPKEATVSGGMAKSSDNSAWEVQAIYSPLPHLGVMVNHFDAHYDGVFNTLYIPPFTFYDQRYSGHCRFTEGGLGGYYQVGPAKEYILSCFAGFGQGHTRNRYDPPPDFPEEETFDSEWNYQRWFVQPALSLKYRRFQVGTGLRFAWIDYQKGEINSRVGVEETGRIELMQSSSPLFLTEMAWTLGLHLRPVIISLNSTAVVRGKESLRNLDLATNYVALTVGVNIHEFSKKERHQPRK